MLAFQAFHLAAYHFAQGTFQPPAASSALGCSDLDGLLSGGPGPVDLNAALEACFAPRSYPNLTSCTAVTLTPRI